MIFFAFLANPPRKKPKVPEVAPTLVSAVINSAGTSLTKTYSVSVSAGAGGSGGDTLSPSGGAATLTYSSGLGSTALVYTISRTINSGETVTTGYTQPGNGLEGTSGGVDVATYSGSSVTNNSTQGASGSAPNSPWPVGVSSPGAGQATVTWTEPAYFADGSAIGSAISAYTIYRSTTQGQAKMGGTGVQSYSALSTDVSKAITSLSAGTHWFAVSSTANGIEGEVSLEVSQVVS